jgi:transposase InsO family protein
VGLERSTFYYRAAQLSKNKVAMMRMKTVYCRSRATVCDPAKYKAAYLLRKLKIKRPNQVWALDISYIPLNRGCVYLLVIIDWKTCCVLGWSLSNTIEAACVVETLSDTVSRYGKPEIINSDQGSQFNSEEYVSFVKGLETVCVSMNGKGLAIDNVIASGSSGPSSMKSYISRCPKLPPTLTECTRNSFPTITTGAITPYWASDHR